MLHWQGGGFPDRNVTAPSAQLQVRKQLPPRIFWHQCINLIHLQGGCFDGYGQTGTGYATRIGPQMAAIRNMIAAIAGF
jgi:hypothetical protein